MSALGDDTTAKLDTGVPHSARLWNYWLGGKDNFAVDRAVADQILAMVPEMVASARADRAFLGRVVRYLAGEVGIRQFLDVGTGIPTANNTHEVAQQIAPSSRVVYVDNDPLVLVHARALLSSHPEGRTDYLDADLREPAAVIEGARRTLNFDQPVALTLLGVLNFVPDDDDAADLVVQLVGSLPPGSYLAISHPTTEINGETMVEALRLWNEGPAARMVLRSAEQVKSLFGALEMVEPGVVSCSQWRPEEGAEHAEPVPHFGGVGRKT
ncbi:SAM-dependent methyltransferase [Jidongwangia harbinensis]|uniref:SAM-dependent methyltransferase n=1 Tax=Jidongwangia harbinensis TaxID=2878561 RepID=UPI001CD93A2A|nr:SAM-dependent methyltransferase [Jidongwangia harbinensis]MCA2216062.1 SAM-dependent methyltransferase [Jidongwangia harbinensis]